MRVDFLSLELDDFDVILGLDWIGCPSGVNELFC
jgi:hypothetical protein